MLTLFTDTDTDITPQLAEKYGYKIISMPYSVDGKTVYPYEDFTEFDFHEFYQMLRSGKIPSTSAISQEKYIEYFEPVFSAGNDILYVHFSRAMSATFDAMDACVRELLAKYPDRKFYEIDTKGISIVSLNIAMSVGEMVKDGMSAEQILKWAETEVDKHAVYFFADDLKFFSRSGRVSGIAGTMGNILGIRPIIYMNAEGKMVSIGKAKGRANAIDRLIEYVVTLGDDVANHRILIANSDAPEIAEIIKTKLTEKFGKDVDIMTVSVNPTAGSHCGPDAVGISFHSIHR